MANLLVMMEFYRGTLLPVSLEALGQARRLGSALGLTVYALVPLPPQPAEDEDITVRLGRFGADKVLLLTGDTLFSEHEMRFEQYADALVAACNMLPPRLLFMGDTPSARDIMPRLAARLGGAFLPRGAVLAVNGALVLCDSLGRHLRVPLESASSDGIPPLTVPVMVTVPAGRHDMAWGDQDAELMIVPPNDESAQTIPNLSTSRLVRGGFTEESLEPLPLPLRVAATGQPLPLSEGGVDGFHAAVPPMWRLAFGCADEAADAFLAPWRVSIGPTAEPTANYNVVLPEAELGRAAAMLRDLLSSRAPVAPIATPGPLPPITKELEGFDDSNEFTPTAESWDYSGDTLNGDEETTARIRAAMGDNRQPPAAYVPPSVVTPPARPAVAVVPAPRGPAAPAGGNPAAAMWEGFATMPDEDEVPRDADGNPLYDEAHADTAPVPIAPPGGRKKEGP